MFSMYLMLTVDIMTTARKRMLVMMSQAAVRLALPATDALGTPSSSSGPHCRPVLGIFLAGFSQAQHCL